MKLKNDIDQFFRRKLKNRSFELNDDALNELEARLNELAPKKKFKHKRALIALFTLLTVIGCYSVFSFLNSFNSINNKKSSSLPKVINIDNEITQAEETHKDSNKGISKSNITLNTSSNPLNLESNENKSSEIIKAPHSTLNVNPSLNESDLNKNIKLKKQEISNIEDKQLSNSSNKKEFSKFY